MSKILLILFIILFIPSALAVDNIRYNPTCINPSYDSGMIFTVTENSATIGNITTSALDVGYFSNTVTRINNGINMLCASSDPTTSGTIAGDSRIFGTSEDGSVWYIDAHNVDYSAGFSTEASPTYLKKLDTLSATTTSRKTAIDSGGNVYTYDGLVIKKYVKALDYSPQTFYTMVDGVSFNGCSGGIHDDRILDLQVDSSDNLHVLTGDVCQAGNTAYIGKAVISSSGILSSSNKSLISSVGGRYPSGGLVLDYTNPTQNFTFAYYDDAASEARIKHNATSGIVDVVGSAISGFTSLSDIAYYNYQIFAASSSNNIIRAFVTNYQGYIPPSAISGTPASLTYQTSTITSQQATYANNSDILLDINVVVGPLSILEDLYFRPSTNFRWKTELNDPSGLLIASHFSDSCTSYGVLNVYCSINETLAITPPITNWTTGNYTVYLKEYNINTYALATLDSTTFEVLNQSANTTGITINIHITSGTGFSALSTIDQWTAMFGLGVNPISKFMFSMMWIVFFMTVGAILLKGMSGGVIFGLFPYSFFIFIEYLPSWTVIVLGIVLAIKLNIFR